MQSALVLGVLEKELFYFYYVNGTLLVWDMPMVNRSFSFYFLLLTDKSGNPSVCVGCHSSDLYLVPILYP